MLPERLENQVPAPSEILPCKEAFIFPKEKLVRFGNIPIFYAAWGERRSIEDLKSDYRNQPNWTEEKQEMVQNIGFDGGYYYPWDFDPYSQEFHQLQNLYATKLAKKVIKERGWREGIDVLVVASISSRADISREVAKNLEEEGIRIGKALFYGQACNGALAAVVDLSQREEVRGGRAVVVGLETLTGSLLKKEDVELVATFGNGGGALAWVVGEEIKHLTGRTIVEKDCEGVIRLPTVYGLPSQKATPYPWYEFFEDGQVVKYEEAPSKIDQYFACSQEGVFLLMPESQYAQMNGMATWKYFVKRMPDLIANVQETYERDYSEQYGLLNPAAIFHPASQPVITGVVRSYERLAQKKSLRQRINLPWRMRETGMNNISAGTALVQWAEMVEKGDLELGRPTMLVSMGIGSVRQAHVVVFR